MGNTDIEIQQLSEDLEKYIIWDVKSALPIALKPIAADKINSNGKEYVQTINLRIQEINNIREKLIKMKSSNTMDPSAVNLIAKRLLLLKDVDKNVALLNDNIDFADKTSKDRNQLIKDLSRLQTQLEQNKTTEDERVKSSLETIKRFAEMSKEIVKKTKIVGNTAQKESDSYNLNQDQFKSVLEQSEELGKLLSKNVTTTLLEERNTLSTKIANIEAALSITGKNGVIAETAISKAIAIIQEKVEAYNDISKSDTLTFNSQPLVNVANALANTGKNPNITKTPTTTASPASPPATTESLPPDIGTVIETNKQSMRTFKKDIQKLLSQWENMFQKSGLITNNASDIQLYQREMLNQVFDVKYNIVKLESALANPDFGKDDRLFRIFKKKYNTSVVEELEVEVAQFSKNLLAQRTTYEELKTDNDLAKQFDALQELAKPKAIKHNNGAAEKDLQEAQNLVNHGGAGKNDKAPEPANNTPNPENAQKEQEKDAKQQLRSTRLDYSRKFKLIFSTNKQFMLKIRRKYNYMKKHTKVLIESDSTLKPRIDTINKMIDTFGKIADQILVDMMKRYVSDIEIIMKMNDILTPEERVQEETNNIKTKTKMEKLQNNLLRIYKTPTLMDLILDSKFFYMYVLKIVNFALFVGALFMTEKIFLEKYMKKVYASNTDPPSLFIMILMLIGIHFMFVVFLVTVMYLLKNIYGGRSGMFIIDGDLITTFLLDYLMFIVLLFIVIAMIGNIIQTKKYFRYKTEGLRGIRAFSLIILALAALFSLIPFFAF